MKNRQQPRVKKYGQSQTPVFNTAPSDEQGDKYSIGLFYCVQSLAVILVAAGVAFSSTNMVKALSAQPVEWTTCLWMTLALTAALLFARTLSWMGVLGSVLLASKMNAWKSQAEICQKAQKMRALMPSGAAWAAMVLAQSLVSRGQCKEAIAVAEAEWERNGESDKNDQTIGPTCAAASYAFQIEGDPKGALTWNERTITTLERAVANMQKPKKGLMAKAMSTQSGQYIGQCQLQLGAAYFGNGNIYFNQMNYRQAKENYRKAMEFLAQAPASEQKDEMMKVAKEQMTRLKHS